MKLNFKTVYNTYIKAVTFSKALIRHLWFGFRKCSPQQLTLRYNICKDCDEFLNSHKNDGTGECNICQCRITPEVEFMNKLAWCSEECPAKKWRRIKLGET